ncbi:class III lanthionine synthetase LanKC [Microbacterium hominis]|uniref:class III lanthionine synthetase LanKC n=1 Tax=Microbacterium hominis TaxID=162426 RepID=UPI001965A3F7|nr:class III lanthionine synthetase LanKC [Microbacterium hominis]QRY39607.1 class III lanthionine synthetase LanKC [Microbacterium hominis]
MDAAHAAFARADALFYDKPGRRDTDSSARFEVPDSRDWTLWTRVDDDHWTHWLPRTAGLPDQGWKIHVSVVPATAAATLDAVAAFCHHHLLAFKHVRSRLHLGFSLAKDADRGAAGKFITVYPPDDHRLRVALEGLDALIGGCPGPYILSDVRWRQGPLFVRYGAFLTQTVVHEGRSVPALRDPRTGELVPDVRAPSFRCPDWVRPPAFLQEEIDALGDMTPPPGFPRITAALHHSNAGGVYAAMIDDRPVVLKEARPHSGWTPDGRDAVDRLVDEERTLARIPDSVSAPRSVGVLRAHGHRFLALEHVAGSSLMDAVVLRNPLTDRTSTPADIASYREWALGVGAELRRQVRRLHASGLTHGDLHPRNVLVTDDGAVSLLDFEMSLPVSARAGAPVGAPGFVAPGSPSPRARDEYALACVELFMFLPLTALLPLDADKAHQLLRTAREHFDLDERWVADRARVLEGATRGRGRRRARPDAPRATMDEIAHTLSRDGVPDRDDRLWPGDPRQFEEPPYALGFGALGVGVALAAAGVALSEAQRDWVRDALSGDLSREPIGLMNGLAGAVWGCRAVGMPDVADHLLDEIVRRDWRELDATLYSGIPGVALTLLADADEHPRWGVAASAMGRMLGDRLDAAPRRDRVATSRGGLFAGATGTALLGLRLYETYGDRAHLDLAARALDVDLATLTAAPDGGLHVNEGWRLIPYLGYGSAGIGLVLAQFLDVTPGTDRHHRALDGILAAATGPFSVQAGLLHGRAGLIHVLAEAERLGFGSVDARRARERHVAALDLHTVRGAGAGEVRFAGDGLMRASCDLASGAAGVLVALTSHTAAGEGVGTPPGALGFLGPFGSRARRDPRRGKGGERDGVPSLPAGAGRRAR